MTARPLVLLPFLAIGFGPAAAQAGELLEQRLGLAAMMQTLNAELLAGDSATLTLEDWCRRHGLADEARVVVRFPDGDPVEPDEGQRERLAVGADEPVRYRSVQLVCGDMVLSQAENWYVPGRLTAEMNAELDGGNTPYGRVIRPLRPFRRTVEAEPLYRPLPDGWTAMTREALAEHADAAGAPVYDPEQPLFRHVALVFAGDGQPLAEVRETYRMTLLASRMR